ncbi:methyltransferase [Reichenbachiella agarivorans]|uniref:tRNA1(Val) (adenine(37)-N6)-methyltransferase n=1 Tax=Reichenbachiella agarivorans TaxID=2979464 RepID=A0ABY6CVP7_9BACT|nr:methyltransferase [Reichenbachiella agarivorans]UXP34004.1 methyltransferase [Reichenbachiella agarivorans]
MANSYFHFKQFTVYQERCAMKVSTEACVLGAWIPKSTAKRILDIGAGTGLISLMLAQRTDAQIDAVEIDPDAATQATDNFANSPWRDRLHLIPINIFEWDTKARYDLIVSNPPFFTSSLKSPEAKHNLAKHDTGSFSKQRFAQCLSRLLADGGVAYVLYPETEAEEFSNSCQQIGLHTAESLIVKNQANKQAVFRVILKIAHQPILKESQTLNIRDGEAYTPEFMELLKNYYLKL